MKYSTPIELNKSETKNNYLKSLTNSLNKNNINSSLSNIKSLNNGDILFPTEIETYLNVNHQENII